MSQFESVGFWIWHRNLTPGLLILADVISYDLDQSEIDAIQLGIEGTSEQRDVWYDYKFVCNSTLSFDFALNEEDLDMIFIKLSFDKALEVSINTIIYILQDFDISHRHPPKSN